MASRTITERMRARRARLADTAEVAEMVDETKTDQRGKKKKRKKEEEIIEEGTLGMDSTWDGAMETLGRLSGSELSDEEMIDEIQNAEVLMEDLKTKHKARKRELADSLKKDTDIKGELGTARMRSKAKLEASLRQRAAADEVVEATTIGQQEEGVARLEEGILEDLAPDVAGISEERKPTPSPRGKTGLMGLVDAVKAAEEAKSGTTTPRKSSAPGGKALGQSIRERLQNKAKAAREKAESDAQKELRPGRRLRGIRDKQLTTRFDDEAMRAEEAHLKKAMEKVRRDRWRRAVDNTKIVPTGISNEEAYDFFCRNWEPEPEEVEEKKDAEKAVGEKKEGEVVEGEEAKEGEEPKPGPSLEAGEEIEEAKDAEGEEEGGPRKKKGKKGKKAKTEEGPKKLTVEELLLPGDDSNKSYTAIRRAEYKPYREKLKEETEKYYVPSMINVETSKKIDEHLQPRYLEEEGLYVGIRPKVSHRNENKLEDRLVHEPDGMGKKWFGEDGKVKTLPDPLKAIPSRPPMPEVLEPLLETVMYKAVTTEYDHRFINGATSLSSNYQVDLDINTLTFTHHHLFSREHVLAARLTQLYENFVFRGKKNIVEFLTEKLRALKVATQHLKESIISQRAQGRGGSNAVIDQKRRLKDYKSEIRVTRHQRDIEEEEDRNLIKNVIKTWKEIKSLRSFQKCTNTSVKLQIRKEAKDRQTDEIIWQQEIDDEVDEIQEAHEEEYSKNMLVYNEAMGKFRAQQQAKQEADARQRQRDSSQGNLLDDDPVAEQKDLHTLNEADLPEPEPPVRVPLDNVREEVREKAFRIRRRPGEPKLTPELSQSATVMPKNQCPRGEQARRESVDKCKLFVRVLFNDKEVSRTPSRNIGQEFQVTFAQIFNIQIVQWPESIKLEVYELSGFAVERMTEVYMAIPESSTTTDNVVLEDMDFSSDQAVAHRHEGVGSDVLFTFEADGSNMISLNTSGVIKSSVCWSVNDDGVPMVPPSTSQTSAYSAFKKFDAVQAIGASGMVDLDKLSKWIAEARLDPNDPTNADLVYLMKPMGGSDGMGMDGRLRVPEYFRLEQLQEEFNFATDEEMDGNLRYRLLMYRDQEIQEFRNYRPIPALEREVPVDIFAEYEKKKKEEERMRRQKDIESHRAAVTRFMQRVRESVMQRFRILAHQKQFSDMVSEEEVPQIGTLIPMLIKLGEVRRPLRPVRKERKKVTAQTLSGIDVKILVNIIRAYDVPIRSDQSSGDERKSERRGRQVSQQWGQVRQIAQVLSLWKKKIDLVRPYVEVMFQKEVYCTSVADGPNPSWNEDLLLHFRPPNNDFTSTNLQTVKDVIYFNLFDEVVVDVLQDDRERTTNIHRRIEKKWLGCLRIPFSTLYLNSKIEGTFRIDMPPVLLGYMHDLKGNRIDSDFGPEMEVAMGEVDQTFLSMFLTIEPQLSPPEPFEEKFESNEDEKLIEAAEGWQSELRKKFQKRDYKTTVTDLNGKSVFITRYFKSIKPPEELLNKSSGSLATAEEVARYVSMIPFVSDSVIFPGICDIWSTCDQFMRMLAGDEEEHAVLLTNYFMSMDKKVWLVLGQAIPEGSTAYVLTEEDSDYWLWNASSGQHYSIKRDHFVPLQSVGCIVNHENIWANIQEHDAPARMSFDVTDAKCWKPFFYSRFLNPGLSSVQPDRLDYQPTERAFVGDLQDKLERTLREKIMEWRPRHVTRWNRYCMQAFRKLLIKFEESGGKSMRDKSFAELDGILQTYKMSGFPLNSPFTEIEPIVDSVFATGVHENEAKEVEFALAVYIHPYPNSILSVWVYVASLTRKK
ncbi:coiled-coil and C2 domain-containing protein 2A-like isoform X3 [Lineus longissimus]|uniref:coiled-coil and C2 domain-containing protein 2A-like isoform X3 n=1 Tax=Lineus longissimus TaxID=88925 RepID=UPI00315DCBBB